MATIKEIAQKAGVSIGTVDRVLHDRGMVNEQTKEKILAVMKELDYHPNHAAQGLAVRKKKLKLCFVIPDVQGHPFFKEIKVAAEKKAVELEQYGVQVIFRTLGTYWDYLDCGAQEKPDEEQISDYLNSPESPDHFEGLDDVDGIALPGKETPELNCYLEIARRRNLPVVFYNVLLQDREYLAYVGCDYVNGGRLAAGLSALAGGKHAKIYIYSEDKSGVTSHDDRLKGFRQEIQEQYPEMEILGIGEISQNQIDNYLSAKEMLQKFPDVNIVYVINPGNYGICKAIARADEKQQISIITNDLVEEQREMVREGVISATVCQEPEKQGSMPLDILFRYLAYGNVPEEKMCYTHLSIHIAQNI